MAPNPGMHPPKAVLPGLGARREPLPARKDVRQQLTYRLHSDRRWSQGRGQLPDGDKDPIELRLMTPRSRRGSIAVLEHQRDPVTVVVLIEKNPTGDRRPHEPSDSSLTPTPARPIRV